eukprot:TRINITY_DN16076_c0_g1_i1.p1 TRINITY_DN16076_c0_g1~~TRINITY_DN16076_c0_g1_i1.p1  ORF type:complete len:448 (+),score=76.24 TRINITY_DN16076_c0_g1_i1:68-1345(+)
MGGAGRRGVNIRGRLVVACCIAGCLGRLAYLAAQHPDSTGAGRRSGDGSEEGAAATEAPSAAAAAAAAGTATPAAARQGAASRPRAQVHRPPPRRHTKPKRSGRSAGELWRMVDKVIASALAEPCPDPSLQLPWTGAKGSLAARAWGAAAGDHEEVFRIALTKICTPGKGLPVRERPLMVEVGSFDGLQALQAARLGCRVSVFEPSPNSSARIAQLMEREEVADAVKVHRVAAAAVAGTVQFRAKGSTGDSMVGLRQGYEPEKVPKKVPNKKAAVVQRPAQNFAVVEVAAVPLDTALAAEPRIDFMKIDTQGWDFEVLRGASELLRSRRVRTLMVEVWPMGIAGAVGLNATDLAARFTALKRIGYELARSNVASLNLRGILGDLEPLNPPSCAHQLIHFMHGVAVQAPPVDPFGFWTDVIARLPE